MLYSVVWNKRRVVSLAEERKKKGGTNTRQTRNESKTRVRPKKEKKICLLFFSFFEEKKCMMMRDKIFLVRFSRTIISPHNTILKTLICVPFYRSRWGRVLVRHRRLLRKRLPLLLNLVLSLVFGDVIRRLLIIELEFHHREVREDNGEHQTSSFVALYPRPQRRRRKKITTIRTSTRSWTIWKVQRKKTSTKF